MHSKRSPKFILKEIASTTLLVGEPQTESHPQSIKINLPIHLPHSLLFHHPRINRHLLSHLPLQPFPSRPVVNNTPTLPTEMILDVAVVTTPGVLLRRRPFFHVDGDFVDGVVGPGCGVASADRALAFVDGAFGGAGGGDGYCAAVAGCFYLGWGCGHFGVWVSVLNCRYWLSWREDVPFVALIVLLINQSFARRGFAERQK